MRKCEGQGQGGTEKEKKKKINPQNTWNQLISSSLQVVFKSVTRLSSLGIFTRANLKTDGPPG